MKCLTGMKTVTDRTATNLSDSRYDSDCM